MLLAVLAEIEKLLLAVVALERGRVLVTYEPLPVGDLLDLLGALTVAKDDPRVAAPVERTVSTRPEEVPLHAPAL